MSFTDGIAALGHRFDSTVLERTKELARALFAVPPAAPSVSLHYGDNERNMLDIYPAATPGAPVFVYVPGGGFIGGDKDDGAFFYRNIGAQFSARGYTCIIPNYRLAPKCKWPTGAQDIDAAMEWVVANVSAYNGDPARIHVCGQSAGATHVATALFTPNGADWHGVCSVALVGGLYSLEDGIARPNYQAYFGQDPALLAKRMPIKLARPIDIPLLIGVAGYEAPAMAASSFSMAARVALENDRTAQFLFLGRHNHVSGVYAVGTAYDDFTNPMIRFHERALG